MMQLRPHRMLPLTKRGEKNLVIAWRTVLNVCQIRFVIESNTLSLLSTSLSQNSLILKLSFVYTTFHENVL